MASLDDFAEIMCDFGLTLNQAKVYMATIQLGLAPVSKISKFSKVRREDVYRVLPKLESLGLIERILGTPIKIRALPLDDTLALLVKHEQERTNKKMSELMVKKKELLKHFKAYNMKMMREDENTQFSLISGRAALLAKAASLLKSVQSEIDIAVSRLKLIQFISVYAELIKKAVNRNVKIRMVTELPEEEDPLPRIIEEQISPGASVNLKYAETLASHFMIYDNKEMMIATSTDAPFTENTSLWTNSRSLIAPLQRTFENMWHTSMNWANFKMETEAERVTRFVRQLRPSDHVLFVYETSEAKYNVLFNYIKYGLENGEAALYVCSDANPGQIRNAMKLFGIDVEKYEKASALKILHYTEFYMINGKFGIDNTLGLWDKFYKEALAKGFKGLRVTGETACFFKHRMVQDLVEYEKVLHRVLEIPMVAICSYNADMLKSCDDPLNLYGELARAHSTVLFTGLDKTLGRIEIRKG